MAIFQSEQAGHGEGKGDPRRRIPQMRKDPATMTLVLAHTMDVATPTSIIGSQYAWDLYGLMAITREVSNLRL